MRSAIIGAALLLLCILTPAHAQTTERWGENSADDFGSVTNDDFISINIVDGLNFGITSSKIIGKFGVFEIIRFLAHFDISALPAGASVSAATFNQYGTYSGSLQVDVYQIANADAGWIPEGAKNGTGASAGEPTWDHKEHNTVSWGGGAGVPSTVRLLDSDSTDIIGYRSYDVTLAVQDWVAGTNNNGGFFVRVTTESAGVDVDASESIDGQLPYLEITYSTGGLRTKPIAHATRTKPVAHASRTKPVVP